jgi:hypothetical protein
MTEQKNMSIHYGQNRRKCQYTKGRTGEYVNTIRTEQENVSTLRTEQNRRMCQYTKDRRICQYTKERRVCWQQNKRICQYTKDRTWERANTLRREKPKIVISSGIYRHVVLFQRNTLPAFCLLHVGFLPGPVFDLQMEAICWSEASVDFHRIT